MKNPSKNSSVSSQPTHGFTIVELLIVVVVIAILAAITIVSYNGITKNARNSAIQGTLSQAAQKLEITKMNSTDDMYPASLSAAGLSLTSSGDTTYTYAVSSDGKLYCLASSQSGRTYFLTNSIQNPKPGTCNSTAGVAGTGDTTTDGTSIGTVASYSIFSTQAPYTTQTLHNDGGGSLKVGNRFYTTEASGIKVTGLRVYNPPSSTSDFLSKAVTAYAYTHNWSGTSINNTTTFAQTPVATKVYTDVRTAGTWTDILFDSPVTIAVVNAASGPIDLVTLAVQYAGGSYYVTAGSPVDESINSTTRPGNYLSEFGGIGRGVNTVVIDPNLAHYGIDMLFTPVTP